MIDNGKNPRLERAREVKRVATEVAKELLREKAETLLAGKGSRDVFSLLGRTFSLFINFTDRLVVKANLDTEAKNKLTEEELLAQVWCVPSFHLRFRAFA